MKKGLKMRALERSDLRFIHELNNNRNIMPTGSKSLMNLMMSSKNCTENIYMMTQKDALWLKMKTA